MLHFIHCALGKDLALVEDRNRPGQTTIEIHVVLNYDQSMLLGQFQKQIRSLAGLDIGQSCRRLIDQQKFWFGYDLSADGKPLPLAVA